MPRGAHPQAPLRPRPPPPPRPCAPRPALFVQAIASPLFRVSKPCTVFLESASTWRPPMWRRSLLAARCQPSNWTSGSHRRRSISRLVLRAKRPFWLVFPARSRPPDPRRRSLATLRSKELSRPRGSTRCWCSAWTMVPSWKLGLRTKELKGQWSPSWPTPARSSQRPLAWYSIILVQWVSLATPAVNDLPSMLWMESSRCSTYQKLKTIQRGTTTRCGHKSAKKKGQENFCGWCPCQAYILLLTFVSAVRCGCVRRRLA
eukprot:SAG31_NODE_1716_length_7452_cov_20.182905_2_plen_260_part_00